MSNGVVKQIITIMRRSPCSIPRSRIFMRVETDEERTHGVAMATQKAFELSCRWRNGRRVAWSLSREMTAKWKMEEKPANISNILKTNYRANKRSSSMTGLTDQQKLWTLSKRFLRSVVMVRVFPTIIREAIMPKQVVQKGFPLLKSILRPNA